MKTWRITDVRELESIAVEVVAAVDTKQAGGDGEREDGAAVLALTGDLGAGKTTFTQIVARTLGVTEHVTSPTFVVMKKYATAHSVFRTLTHLDAYRIETIDEMRPLRFSEEINDPTALVVIEWAEKIAPLLPDKTIQLTFTIEGTQRVITMT